jgi:hypothetical protein
MLFYNKAARISVAVTYQATPPPTEARIPSPKPTLNPYLQPTLSRMPTDKPSSTTSPIHSPTLAPTTASTISVSVELVLEALSSECSTDDKVKLRQLIANATGRGLDSVRILVVEVVNMSSALPSRRLSSFYWTASCSIYANSAITPTSNFTAMVESELSSDVFELSLADKLSTVTSVLSVSAVPATRRPSPIPSFLLTTFPTPQPSHRPSLQLLPVPTSAPLCNNGCNPSDDQFNTSSYQDQGASSASINIELLLVTVSLSITFGVCLILCAFVSFRAQGCYPPRSMRDDVADEIESSTQRARTLHIPEKQLWRTARFKAYGADNIDRVCSICISDIGDHEIVKELRCTHFYHARCLDSWLSVSVGICPLCKNPVLAPNPLPWREALADGMYAALYALIGEGTRVLMAADATSNIELVSTPTTSQQMTFTSDNEATLNAIVDSTGFEPDEEHEDIVNIDSYLNDEIEGDHESEPIESTRTSSQQEWTSQENDGNSALEEGGLNTLSPHTFEGGSSLILERLRVHEQQRHFQHRASSEASAESDGSEEASNTSENENSSDATEADRSVSSRWDSSARTSSTEDKIADDGTLVRDMWDNTIPDQWIEEEDD